MGNAAAPTQSGGEKREATMTTKTAAAFKFDLGQAVVTASGALATVVARAEFVDGKPHNYLVRFAAAPQRDDNFAEGELTAAPKKAAAAVEEEPAAATATTAKGKK
jgi:hypothetical protein